MAEIENLPNPLQFARFKDHLTPENSRIIFSGKFGIGKTTFLEDFFKKERPDDYVIHLSPVHYSISSNEDIVDLLKYDIIYSLLSDLNATIEIPELTEEEITQGFINYKSPELILSLIEAIPKIGEPLSKIVKALGKFDADYFKFRSEIVEGDEIMLKSLDKFISDKKATSYHEDFFTEFIKNNLAEIKSKKKGSETILIIDDLDRVDPEHIFRLFNVFAAHLHSSNNEDNKFGFDKVVFSCDIDNIQSIYHHKYGARADFTGYIDKFYSNNIFRLDNREIIQFWIQDKLPRNDSTYSQTDIWFLTDTLNFMLGCGVINFRSIKLLKKELIKNLIGFIDIKNQTSSGVFKATYLPKIVPILTLVAGDNELLLQKLENCKSIIATKPNKKFAHSFNNTIEVYVAKYLIPISEYSTVRFRGGQTKLQLDKYIDDKRFIYYSIIKEGLTIIALIDNNGLTDIEKESESLRIIPTEDILSEIFWGLLIKAIKELMDKNYLT